MKRPLIERYRDRLPVTEKTPVVTLYEGDTPLIPLKGPPEANARGITLFAKYEGLNPTASFKDRGMTLAVSKAVEAGAEAVAAASTGNTSASAAAYAARAGIKAIVVLPAGRVALGKLAQTLAHGAELIQIDGNFDDALRIVVELTEAFPVALVNSLNPYRIQGQKTIAFEVTEALGAAPDFHALPVGNAGNITAHWLGYTELFEAGLIPKRPKMLGFQAEGAAPIVKGHPVAQPETVATAIRIGNPASWKGAIQARDESGGAIEAVSDQEILAAWRYLAASEGLFVEPASAAALAGVWRWLKTERIPEGSRVVLTLTGHGLKDPQTAEREAKLPGVVEASLEAVARAAGLGWTQEHGSEAVARALPRRLLRRARHYSGCALLHGRPCQRDAARARRVFCGLVPRPHREPTLRRHLPGDRPRQRHPRRFGPGIGSRLGWGGPRPGPGSATFQRHPTAMNPAWLSRTLVWAGTLLFIYWALINPNHEGAAYAVGLMIGAGTFVYGGPRPHLVPLMVVFVVLIGALELVAPVYLKNQQASPGGFFTGYLTGLIAPYIAHRLRK